MKPKYLTPNKKGLVKLVLSVFTQGDMELVQSNSPFFNQIAPVQTTIEITQEGLFDLDVIERIVKMHLNPKTLRWVNTGGKRPIFVPFGMKATSEIPGHLYDNPRLNVEGEDPGTKAHITLVDTYGRADYRERNLILRDIDLYITNDEKDENKIPGLPLGARLGPKDLTIKADKDVLRMTVGRVKGISFEQVSRLPVPVDVKKLLPLAQQKATSRSTWITEPPTAMEFETSMIDIMEIEKEFKSSGMPGRITMVGKRLGIYATDRGNSYCPEAINYDVPADGHINKSNANWGIGRDGEIFSAKDRPDDHLLRMAIIYAGPTYILRFVTIEDDGKERNIFGGSCAAYLTRIQWYRDMIKQHKKEKLIKDWVPPPETEDQTWFFMSSDWCMRNDANIKRGAAGGHAKRATVDLYSRPHLSLKRWIHGPYRAKYRESSGKAFPGLKVHKSSVSAVDLQNLLNHANVHGGEQFAGLQQAMALPKVNKKKG